MIIIQYELEVKAEQIIKKAEDTVKLAKTTVMASSQQNNNTQEYEDIKHKLELTESLLEVQKVRVKELEDEATMWRLKYEKNVAGGHGDK